MSPRTQPRVPAGRPDGGRFAPAWLYETGPLPFLDRPSEAELPPPPPRTWTRPAREFGSDVPVSVVAVCCPDCVYGDQA